MKHEYGNGIELSHTDYRSYRHFELQNGMKVMIISTCNDIDDNHFISDTLSAAALCINVGSFSDPHEAQGLSHLLEHMLFHGDIINHEMRTFHNYLQEYNGYWDSKTSNEHTLFYFSITEKYFNEALHLFALHFINPTLKLDGMRKSIEKIDMEFQKVKTRDYAKLRGFISSLAVKGSPYRLFSRGNKQSLITEPEKNNIDVYGLLKKHWTTLYSAHRMTLVVQSKDSLNKMERIVRENFSNIPANRSVKIDLTRYRNSFDSPEFLKLYHVDSTRNKEQLRMVWAVPSVCTLYESNPVAVLAYFLSDKHPYGLENYLKNNHLATEVKCEFSAMSDFDNSTICALITICIDLNGTRPDLFKITKIVYEYLRFLSNKANDACINKNSEEYIHNTTTTNNSSSNNTANIKSTFDSCVRDFQLTQKETFQCRTIFGPQETVIWIATMLHHTLPQDVHSAYLIIKTLDIQVYSELLDTLSKQQACLIHSFKLNPTIHRNIHVEKWYNLQYTQEEVSTKQIGCLNNLHGTIPFSLPLKVNGNVHEYLTLSSENDIQTPINLTTEFKGTVFEDYGSLWYQQLNNQLKNEAYIYVQISTGMELNYPLKACLSRLLQLSIKLRSSNCKLLTMESRMKSSVNTNVNGPEFIIKGPSEKISNYYKEFLKSVIDDITKEHFIQCKTLLIEELNNQLSDPNLVANNINSCLWYPNEYIASSLLNSLEYITIADLMAFQTKYFYQMEIIMYIVGDVTCNLAKDLFTYTIGFFKCHPKPKEIQHIEYISIQPGIYYHSVPNISNNEKFHQLIQFDRIENASSVDEFYCQIITELLKSHAKQYFQHYESVNGSISLDFYKFALNSSNLTVGTRLSLNSQLNKHDGDYLINCIQVFWNEIAPRVIACVDNNNLEQICNTIISSELIKNNNLELISQFYWDKIKTNLLDGGISRKNMLKREMNREKLLEYFHKTYLNPMKKTTIFIDFRNIESNEFIKSLNITKINGTNFNPNLNSYLKDEDLMNTSYEFSRQTSNDLRTIQRIKTIKHIESFRTEFNH
ncbi:unnamed protein product [Schistosoma bovis]|nr:unnamed protein product [Schistosoma bovis]